MTKDTPVSAATMAGFYEVDDSPAAQASRLQMHQDLNADAQKKYKDTSHISQGAIDRARQNAYIDPAALDKRISQREQYSRDKAKTMGNNIFGDMGAFGTPTWNSSKPAEKQEKFDPMKMYETITGNF